MGLGLAILHTVHVHVISLSFSLFLSLEDSSFLDVYEDKLVSEASVADEREEPAGGDVAKETKPQDEARVTSKDHRLRLRLLTALAENLQEVEKVGGVRAIPYMQVIVFLCGYLENDSKDSKAYNTLLTAILKLLDGEEMKIMIERSPASESLLLMLRFLNIIMSRKRIRAEGSSSGNRLWSYTAKTLLSWNCMSYCLQILKGLLMDKNRFKTEESSSPSTDLLKPRSQSTQVDFSPFFQQQYVKYHSSDVFEDYPVLLADIVLALPCQLKKFCEKSSTGHSVEFDSEWMETLCEYFMATSHLSNNNKKQVRKVLIYVCGSKENYRLIRDKYGLRSYMRQINDICDSVRFDMGDPSSSLIHSSYATLLKLIEQLRLCDEIARTRTGNWQLFCMDRKGERERQREGKSCTMCYIFPFSLSSETLPALFTISLSVDEGLSMTLLQLIFSALSGSHPATTPEKKDDPMKSKEKSKKKDAASKTASKSTPVNTAPGGNIELCRGLCLLLLETVDDGNFEQFVSRYLLESNQSSVRWQTHSLLHTLYK